MTNPIKKFNKKVALFLSHILCSMWFFYFCVGIVGLQLWKSPPNNLADWVSFISQTCIQLCALSVLGFSGDLQSEKMERKIKQILQYEKKEDEKKHP